MPKVYFDDLIEETEEKPAIKQPTTKVDFSGLEPSPAQKIYRAISPYVDPTIEALGTIGGGIAGAPVAPPWGMIAGAGLGYAGAKQFQDILRTAIGEQTPKPLLKELTETGREVVTGATLEATGGIVGRGVTGIARRVLAPMAGRMTPEAFERMRIAEEMGVPVTAAEITQARSISLVESLLDKIAFSAGKIQDHRLAQLKAFVDHRERLLEKAGSPEDIERVGLKIQEGVEKYLKALTQGKIDIVEESKDELLRRLGSTDTMETLGLKAKEALKLASQRWQDTGRILYINVGKKIPEGTMIYTPELQKTAFEFLRQQAKLRPALQDKALMTTLRDLTGLSDEVIPILPYLTEKQKTAILQQSMPEYDWEGLQLTIQKINQLIRSTDVAIKEGQVGVKGLSSTEGGIYKQLKMAAIRDIDNFAKTAGEDVKTSLELANEFWASGKKIYNSPLVRKILKTNPEKLVDIVVTPRGVSDIKLFKKAVGAENFHLLKEGFSNKLLGDFTNGKTFLRTLKRYGDEVLAEFYSPQEIQQLKALGELDIRLDKTLVGNPFFRSLVRTGPEKVVDFIVKPNNTKNIDLIETVLGKETAKEVAAKLLEKVLALNKHELFSPEKFITQLRRYGDRTMSRLLGDETWRDLQRLGQVSQITRGAEALAGNPSGTAQNLITFVTGGMVLKDPLKKSWLILAPNLLAKAYLSKLGRQYLTTGFKMPADSKEAISLFTKIVGILGVKEIEKSTRVQSIREAERIIGWEEEY